MRQEERFVRPCVGIVSFASASLSERQYLRGVNRPGVIAVLEARWLKSWVSAGEQKRERYTTFQTVVGWRIRACVVEQCRGWQHPVGQENKCGL